MTSGDKCGHIKLRARAPAQPRQASRYPKNSSKCWDMSPAAHLRCIPSILGAAFTSVLSLLWRGRSINSPVTWVCGQEPTRLTGWKGYHVLDGGWWPRFPAPREGSKGVGRGGPGQGADLGLVKPVGLLGAAERHWGRLLGFSAGPEFLHLPRSRGKSSERRVLFSLRLSVISSVNAEGESAFPGVAITDLYRPLD